MGKNKSWIFFWLLAGVFLLGMTGCQSSVEGPQTNQEGKDVGQETAVTLSDEGGNTPVRRPGKSYEQEVMGDGTIIEYALVLPDNYSADQSFPLLLAFPPGAQTRELVEAGLSYWESEAVKRGWIVVSPIAPNQVLFFRGSESYLPEFASYILEEFSPEGGKFHVAGISNGGISAFRFAIDHTEYVHSLLVLPGYPLGPDQANLVNLKDIPVAMFVGGEDSTWVSQMESTEQALSDLGGSVTLEIVQGEGHVIRSLSGERLFDLLDSFR